MTYRISRHLTTSTFTVGNQLCKVFLDPISEYRPGYWVWNVGFAAGKSRRQLNDWYNRRKNRRQRSLDRKIGSVSGLKTAPALGAKEVLRLRWNIQPGDAIMLDCTSGDPERQFRAFIRWLRKHPEWVIDYEKREFFWYRPPYVDDPIRQQFAIRAIVPEDPLANTFGERYFDCFRVAPKDPCTELSMEQMLGLLGRALNN
jgi:hypothetical protein